MRLRVTRNSYDYIANNHMIVSNNLLFIGDEIEIIEFKSFIETTGRVMKKTITNKVGSDIYILK